MDKRKIAVALVLGLLMFALFKHLTRPTDEKAAILAVVRAIITAVEEQQVGDFMSHIAPDCTSNISGAKNYSGLKTLIRSLVINPRVQIHTRTIKEYADYDAGTVTGQVELELSAWQRKTKSKLKDVLPGNARKFRFIFELKKIDGRWMIYRITRKQVQN